MSMFQETDEVRGERVETHLTIYSVGTAVVNEKVLVLWQSSDNEAAAAGVGRRRQQQQQQQQERSVGVFGSIFGSRSSATDDDEDEFGNRSGNLLRTIRVEQMSNSIDIESLFTSDPHTGTGNAKRSIANVFTVQSSEVKNVDGRTSVRELLEQSKGQNVRITDISGRSDELVSFEGVLEDIHSNVVVLGTSKRIGSENPSDTTTIGQDGGSTIVELPQRSAVQFPGSIDWNVLRPYLQLRVLYRAGLFKPGTQIYIPLVYETNGVSFEMSYMFIIEENEQAMTVGMKAYIRNDTTSDFSDARISLVEIEQPDEEVRKRYRHRPRYQQRFEKATLYASARGVPSAPQQEDEAQFERPTLDQDKSRSQKTFRIDDQGVPIELKAKTQQSFIIHQSPDAGVAMKMDYVFRPQKARILRQCVRESCTDEGAPATKVLH